ncbi:histidine-rich glycoprotein precursor [Xenopus laevis]|uniref:Cystatin domain fetuin-like protein n=1 Tax=Xenopus laevis TaxID=8355 RepID=Q7SYH2_XENLA|nr:histidine-rich glycoprotein precursor [Xenopus laevis]AAP82289.1 cystatin domain fetuin-like protein [Xenopus laevis]
MKCVFIVVLFGLVPLCKATSPVFPVVDPIQCNTTESEVHVALDLINEDRREGFIFKPLRVVEAYEQHVKSHKYPASTIYYLTIDVLETKCSVLSGKPWEECEEPYSLHEWVFGECKAIILISLPWRVQKLISYNCTITSVHPGVILSTCPDCPTANEEITPTITETADTLIAEYNKDSNNTRYFKIDHIERVRSQWVVGPSYFIQFTIKETDCMKTQENVVLSNCNFLDDREAHVGFCSGSMMNSTFDGTEHKEVSCDIYEPKDDHSHYPDDHGPYASHREIEVNIPEGQEKPEAAVQEKSQDKSQKGRHHHKHRHHPSHKGHKHGRRHHHHHPHHHDHPPHHHHHHHHHHPNHTSSEHHEHHHHHPNHTSSEHGSSSEEHTDKKAGKKADRKCFMTRSKGVVQKITLASETDVLPAPTITISRPSFRTEYIQFPEAASHLPTCPWTIEEKEEIVPFLPHEK